MRVFYQNLKINKLSVFLFSTLREKCPYSELFWSVFSRIRTEYGEILRMRENTDQNISKHGTFYAVVAFHNTDILNFKCSFN